MIRLLAPFAPLFSTRVWQNAQVLLMGAILAPGRRTVSSALRAMGLDQHKRFHRYHRVLADRAYASLKLLESCRKLSDPITFVSRLRLDAALYEPAPPRHPHQMGRPRLKGERLPTLSKVAETPKTVWKPTKIANWYGSEERVVELASETAVWYSTGLFAVPVRWVLVRDPQGQFKTQALLCTDLDADPQKIVSWFVMRWQLEVTFQEMRRHLGFETQRQWSDMAIRRTTPALLGLFSMITLFAHQRMGQVAGAFRRQAAW
jgi:hypothetical protein